MTTVRYRENTFKVDLSNFAKRPSFEEIHLFVQEKIGLKPDQIVRLQMNHAQNCAHIKCVDLKSALDAVDQHNEKHEIEVNGKKTLVRMSMDDGGVEVKLHDLSENISNEEILEHLMQYGEVINIKEVIWGEHFAFKGISSGIRIVKMILRKHIRSFITIQGEQTLVTYRNQPQTCRHCTNLSHPGSTCVQNKKLLGQKADLEKRLKDAQKKSTSNVISYSSVLNNNISVNQLMPRFTTATMNPAQPLAEKTTASPAATSERETTQINTSTSLLISPAVEANDSSNSNLHEKSEEQSLLSNPQHKPPADTDMNFKKPAIPANTTTSMEFSENESSESCAENTGEQYRAVKRGRGRPKKPKLDSSRSVSPLAP